MWLPTPIYERVPQFWLLIGLLFMTSGAYLGFDYSLSFAYFAVGFACVIWSGAIFMKRARYRSDPARRATAAANDDDAQSQEQSAKQTEAPVGHAS